MKLPLRGSSLRRIEGLWLRRATQRRQGKLIPREVLMLNDPSSLGSVFKVSAATAAVILSGLSIVADSYSDGISFTAGSRLKAPLRLKQKCACRGRRRPIFMLFEADFPTATDMESYKALSDGKRPIDYRLQAYDGTIGRRTCQAVREGHCAARG